MAIYDNVMVACKEKGISVSELEKELNFARSSIYKWNKNIPSAEKLKMVAERLDKPMEYFFIETETDSMESIISNDKETKKEKGWW